MIDPDSNEYNQIIYTQIRSSLQRLTALMDQLTEPTLLEHCRLWKNQKGVKKLIELAINGDKLLNRESKNIKKSLIKQEQAITLIKATAQQDKPDVSSECKAKVKKQTNPESYVLKLQEIHQQDLKQNESHQIKVKREATLQNQDFKLERISKIYFQQEIQLKIKKQEQKKNKQYMRGPYKNYSRQLKQKVVELYKSNSHSISKLSNQFGIPIKNIKRWAENGVDRKEGAGRKRLDPTMQDKLYQQISNIYSEGSRIQFQQIRYLALEMSNHEDFKASKGWIISFAQRYDLNKKYQII